MKRLSLLVLALALWLGLSNQANATGRRLVVFTPTNAVFASPFVANYGFSRFAFGTGFYGSTVLPAYATPVPRFVTVQSIDPLTGAVVTQIVDRFTGLPLGLGY